MKKELHEEDERTSGCYGVWACTGQKLVWGNDCYDERVSIFLLLLARLIPLYAIIGLGYIAGKKLEAQKETIAALLIYVIAPIVVFDGVLRTPITWSTLSIPFFFLLCCCLLCGAGYFFASFFWKDANRNILAFTSGSGNTGYFGLPVSLAIFGESHLGFTVLSLLGFLLYENSLGFFITARGKYSAKESFGKLLRLPTLYAFALAIVVQKFDPSLGEIYTTAAQNFRGAYAVLGMMMIGLGIASMDRFRFDWRFTGIAFSMKFVAWPALIGAVILLDNTIFHVWNTAIYQTMILMAIVPLAANTIVFATHLKAEPEKASVAVLLSTLFALGFIPLIAGLFLV